MKATNQEKKNYLSLIRVSKKIFPNASQYSTLVQIAPNQTPEVKKLAEEFNTFLMEKYRTLTGIPSPQFRGDNVHWTTRSAKMIFENWMTQLN